MKSVMTVPYALPSVTFDSTGNAGSTQVDLKTLPATYLGKIAHVDQLVQTVEFTPTWTTAGPDTVGNNNVFTRFDLYDGSINRFLGGHNVMRMFEILEAGRLKVPDPDTDTASATQRKYTRVLPLGPTNYAGAPTDWCYPVAALRDAQINVQSGTLAQIAGNGGGTISACTGTMRITARLALLDEVRIPPAYERRTFSTAVADVQLPGRALYDVLALLNSANFDAISAGDFGSIQLDLGKGFVVPSINDRDLQSAFWAQKEVSFQGQQGEPLNASDDSMKVVNTATPTAVVGAVANVQPVIFSGREQYISKLHLAESLARLQWSGSQATAVILSGRILAQPMSVVGNLINKAFAELPFSPGTPKIPTLSKREYTGPFVDFMPWKVPVKSQR